MDNKKSYKENNKYDEITKIEENRKNYELIKTKEKFMKLKGYRIKVGKDTFLLFKNEAFYLQMLYFEKVFIDFHKQLFNGKEAISLIFRLTTLRKYLRYFQKHYGETKVRVFYDKRRYENPLKIKFPNLTCCLDPDRREEIEEEIENLENKQLKFVYDRIKSWVSDAVFAKYVVKNQISYNNFDDYDFDHNFCIPESDNPDMYFDPEYVYDHIEDPYSLYDSDDDYEYECNTNYVCLLDYD